MQCEDVRTIAELSATATLSDEQRTELEHHLSVCAPCRREVTRVHENHERFETDAEFCPGETFWKDFHKRVSCEMNQSESIPDRFHRWRLTHLPAALCQYSALGLLRMILLMAMITLIFLVFRSEHTAKTLPDTASYRIDQDSTGMPNYQPVDHK